MKTDLTKEIILEKVSKKMAGMSFTDAWHKVGGTLMHQIVNAAMEEYRNQPSPDNTARTAESKKEMLLIPFPPKDANCRDGGDIKMWMLGWEAAMNEVLSQQDSKEVTKEYCDCKKPWGVGGSCVVCELPINLI